MFVGRPRLRPSQTPYQTPEKLKFTGLWRLCDTVQNCGNFDADVGFVVLITKTFLALFSKYGYGFPIQFKNISMFGKITEC